MAQGYLFDVGWIFFAAWTMILAGVSAIAFRSDLSSDDEKQKAKSPSAK